MRTNPSSSNPASGSSSDDGTFAEVLSALHSYLSDQVPPLMLVNEGDLLLRIPPEPLKSCIQSWVASQYRSGANTPLSDYLYHVARKIHQIRDLQIFPDQAFLPFQTRITKIVVELCPEPDRAALLADIEKLGTGQGLDAAPVHVDRHAGTGGGARGGAGDAPERTAVSGRTMAPPASSPALSAMHAQRLELLLSRLESTLSTAGEGAAPSAEERRTPIVAAASLSAVEAATDSTQLHEVLSRFRLPGLPSSPADVLAVLARRLPDWAVPTEAPEVPGTVPRTVEAVRKIVSTADSPAERHLRFRKLVEAAADELNQGFLGRAVTLLDLAQRMVERGEVDEASATQVTERGQELLDLDRLMTYTPAEETHPLLRRVLAFFRDLDPSGLVTRLETEEDRERRRAILSLLKVHGPAARAEALSRLERSIKEGGTLSWYFERNLILMLRDIPPSGDEDFGREVDALLWLARPGGPLPCVRAALGALGAIHDKRSERALSAIVVDLERALDGTLELSYTRDDIEELLDRAMAALAAMPSRDARRRVVRHALSRKNPSATAIERLAPLGQHDLGDDPELVAYLLEALHHELPSKIFGRTILTPRRDATIRGIIRSLAATDRPEVRKVLSEVAKRFPGQDFAVEAQRILTALGTSDEKRPLQAAVMSGDLELLSLPNLLQSIADARLTGTLTLFDRDGNTTATILLADGSLAGAATGHLSGDDAFYQILQRPPASRFVFTQGPPTTSTVETSAPRPVLPLMLEGMRRLDELRAAEALVPAGSVFRAGPERPSPVPGERDEDLVRQVWEAARSGRSPAACEAELPADSYRIRRMYEHWVQEGALIPAEQ